MESYRESRMSEGFEMTNVPMTRPEEMLAEHETDLPGYTSFVKLNDGRIIHVSAGMFSTSEDGGLSWADWSTRTDVNGAQVKGSMLVKISGNVIGLAETIRAPNISPGESGKVSYRDLAHVAFRRSDDGGQTWSEPVRVTPVGIGSYALHDVMIRTSSGRLVIPIYIALGKDYDRDAYGKLLPGQEPTTGKLVNGQWVNTGAHYFDPRLTAVYVCYSDDEGRSWQRNEDGELMIVQDWNTSHSYCAEPSVAEVAPGRLLMVMRTGLGRLFQAWSHDDGETWTWPQPTSLAASTAPGQIRYIPDTGHLLVVWTQESQEEIKRGFTRTRLSSAVSRNGGSVWEFFQNVESLHEATRVEPGPIEATRPTEVHLDAPLPASEREAKYVTAVDYHRRFSYPSVQIIGDNVLVEYSFARFEEDPTRAELVRVGLGGKPRRRIKKLKVLPLEWFYGGKKPADNPFLTPPHYPASP